MAALLGTLASCTPRATYGLAVEASGPKGVITRYCAPPGAHADSSVQPLGPELWFAVQQPGGDGDYVVVIYEKYESLIPPHPSRAKWRPAMGLAQPPPDASKTVRAVRSVPKQFAEASLRDSLEVVHEGQVYRLELRGIPSSGVCPPP